MGVSRPRLWATGAQSQGGLRTGPRRGKEAGVFIHQCSALVGCDWLLGCPHPWHSRLTHMGAKFRPGPENDLMKRDQEASGVGTGVGAGGAAERWALVRASGSSSTKVVGDFGKGSVVRERGRSHRGLTYGKMRENTKAINHSENMGKGERQRYLGLGKGLHGDVSGDCSSPAGTESSRRGQRW